MKSFMKVCGIGCGVLIFVIIAVLIFFGFKGFDFGRRGKGVEIKGYETKIEGTSDVIEFQNIGYSQKLSGEVIVKFAGPSGSMVFENVSHEGGNKAVVLYSSGSSMMFNVTGALGLRSEDLFIRDNAQGKLNSFTHAKPSTSVNTTASPSPEKSRASDALYNNFSVDTTDLSGTVNYSGQAAVLSNPGAENTALRASTNVEFGLTPQTKVYVVENARLMLPNELTLNSKNDDNFFSNLAFFTGRAEISGLNVNESGSRANLTSRGRKLSSGSIKREGNTWRLSISQEAFQVILNDKVLIPATLAADPLSTRIKIPADANGGSVNVKLHETTGRGDAVLKEVKVEGPAKDWINLPKTKGIFGPLFEELPDEAKPFFILPTIFGVIFVDTFLAFLQPDPLPEAIFAGDSFQLQIGAYPPTDGAALPSDPTATITLTGKNYDPVTIKVSIEK